MEQTPKQEISKKDRRALKREQTQTERATTARKAGQKRYAIIAIIALVVAGGGYWWWNYGPRPDASTYDPLTVCVSHTTASRMHWHPNLNIRINGEDVELPANIGVPSLTCLRPLHTHDASGQIHVESPIVRDYTLGEFFQIWGKPFSRMQLLEHAADDTHHVTLTVDGKPSEEFEDLVMKDHQQIVLSYETIGE